MYVSMFSTIFSGRRYQFLSKIWVNLFLYCQYYSTCPTSSILYKFILQCEVQNYEL